MALLGSILTDDEEAPRADAYLPVPSITNRASEAKHLMLLPLSAEEEAAAAGAASSTSATAAPPRPGEESRREEEWKKKHHPVLSLSVEVEGGEGRARAGRFDGQQLRPPEQQPYGADRKSVV